MAPRARLMQTGLAISYLIKHVDPFDTAITLVPPSDSLRARQVALFLSLTRKESKIEVFNSFLSSARGHQDDNEAATVCPSFGFCCSLALPSAFGTAHFKI